MADKGMRALLCALLLALLLPACTALFPLRAAEAASARWGSSASSSASTSTSVLNEVR